MSVKRVQFGAGGTQLAGWINHDAEVDVTKLPLPYETDSVDTVFAEHLTEHLTVAQAVAFLDDVRRILKPGGKVRICCPVLDRLDPVHARDIALNHGHLIIFSKSSLESLLKLCLFKNVAPVMRSNIDGHHKVIGMAKDDKETHRVEGFK